MAKLAGLGDLEELAHLPVSEIAAFLDRLEPEQRKNINRILHSLGPIWAPLDGPQRMAAESLAEVVGYGGAAGGGKTDLAIGLALTQHQRTGFFRREATQLLGVRDRLTEILGTSDHYKRMDNLSQLPGGRVMEYGSTPHPGNETRYQGRPKDLLVLDEAPNFLESQARFLMGWVRTTLAGQRCRTLMTFNPPTDSDGLWIIEFFAPWIDDKYPKPAEPGELRWFVMHKGREIEVDGPETVVRDGEELLPQSRTFIPSRVSDNPFLAGTGYMRQLQAMPEPLRSQMLYGDFKAGLGDDPWQVIPTEWVTLAMNRWKKREDKKTMDSMGVDVARGGVDKPIIARRHDIWFDELIEIEGADLVDGPNIAGRVIAARRHRAPVHIDIVGWGASPFDYLAGNSVQVIGFNGAARSGGTTDDEAKLTFKNKRAESWWRMREVLDPARGIPIELPPDPKLRADLCTPKWKLSTQGIQIEDKEEIIKRLGRSPDRGDAVVLANISTVRWEMDPKNVQANRHADYSPIDHISDNDYDPLGRG